MANISFGSARQWDENCGGDACIRMIVREDPSMNLRRLGLNFGCAQAMPHEHLGFLIRLPRQTAQSSTRPHICVTEARIVAHSFPFE